MFFYLIVNTHEVIAKSEDGEVQTGVNNWRNHPYKRDEKMQCTVGWLTKNTILRWLIALRFFKPLCRKKTLAKAVARTMIFNTASAMTNLSLNSQNRLFSCSGIGLLIGFIVFHLIKIRCVKPETCAIIFSTASSVNKFMKQRNKRIKNVVYVAAHAPPFFFSLTKTFYETRDL